MATVYRLTGSVQVLGMSSATRVQYRSLHRKGHLRNEGFPDAQNNYFHILASSHHTLLLVQWCDKALFPNNCILLSLLTFCNPNLSGNELVNFKLKYFFFFFHAPKIRKKTSRNKKVLFLFPKIISSSSSFRLIWETKIQQCETKDQPA